MIEEFGTYKFTFLQGFFYFLINAKIARGSIRGFIRKLLRAISSKDSIFDVIHYSVRMRIAPWTNNTEAMIVSHYKMKDRREIDYIASTLPTDGVFVDIGANIGYYSLMIAKQRPEVRIIAYEPYSVVFDRMIANIELNGFSNITAIACGIGERKETLDLNIETENLGGSSFKEFESSANIKKQALKINTLENSLKELGIEKIDALKIDVEGFEDKALLPYFKSVKKNHHPDTIIIEYSHTERWDENIIEFLLKSGYIEATRTNTNLILIKEQ